MSFLSRIFGSKPESDEPVRWSWPRIGILSLSVGTDDSSMLIGSHSELRKAVNAARKLHESDSVPVYLEREPQHPDDPNAVAVMSGLKEPIGYLNKEDAALYASVLDKVAFAGFRATCTATISDESDAITIDIPPVAEIAAKFQSASRL